MDDRKLFIGARVRRLRRELGLGQAAMAAEIGISPSYLNHLERNQRPVTAQVLLRLARTYDIDVKALAEGGEAETGDFAEVFRDRLLRDLAVPRIEIAETLANAPAIGEAVLRLYQALLDHRRDPAREDAAEITPTDWVREQIGAARNHFPVLDEGAEADPIAGWAEACGRLEAEHRIAVRVVAPEEIAGSLRVYDIHRRRLLLSELLAPSSRTFAVAYQYALLRWREAISALVDAAHPPDASSRSLLTTSLANYAAAAHLMPYQRFQAAAERHRYDLDRLAAAFETSLEQVAHRLTTLDRPGARGVPLFMLRADAAGTVSKRFAGDAFPFSRFGGACPRWNLHHAFRTPGQTVTQIIETEDGERYLTFSRAIERSTRLPAQVNGLVAIGMGCALRHASRIGYADGLDLVRPRVVGVGPACRLCHRPDCPDRAAPPADRTLMVGEYRRAVSPYPFFDA